MKKIALFICILFFALGAKAQSVVNTHPDSVGIEAVEYSEAYAKYRVDSMAMYVENRKQIDSLLLSNDELFKTTKALAIQELEQAKKDSEAELKALKEEEIVLKKELEKEKKKTERSLKGNGLKNPFKKTRYEEETE